MPMNATSSSTMMDRSNRTAPTVSCGISRRNNFTGGSVTERMISRMTTVAPRGCHSRLNDRMNSTTTRAISNSQKMKSANPMEWTNSVNESPTLVIKRCDFDDSPGCGQHGNVSLPTRAAHTHPPNNAPAVRVAGRLLVGVKAGLGDASTLLGRDVDVGG